MTIELFRNNSYLKEHKTIISETVSEGLVLNETIFYPEGGGQPGDDGSITCLLYTSPSPRDKTVSRMPSSA